MDAEKLDRLMLTYEKSMPHLREIEHEALKTCWKPISQRQFLGLVTSRVKDVISLRGKLKRKAKLGLQVESICDVWNKIRDLVGVRISVYSQSHLDRVEHFISEEFNIHETKVYTGNGAIEIIQGPGVVDGPESTSSLGLNSKSTTRLIRAEDRPYTNGHHGDPFGGFRGKIFKTTSKTGDHLIGIEIQVVSIYTQIWADIAHDISYKQYSGRPSSEEKTAIETMHTQCLLLNDMSATFFRHHEARLASDAQPFASSTSLAQFLESSLPHEVWVEEPAPESSRSLDGLRRLLDALGKNSRQALAKVLDSMCEEDELTQESYQKIAMKYRPLPLVPSLWVIDRLLSSVPEPEWESRRQAVVGQSDFNTYRLRVALSSILWFYELFSDSGDELLDLEFAEEDLSEDETESIAWAFREPCRTLIIDGQRPSDMNGHPQVLWDWIAKLTRKSGRGAAFDLAFRMCQLGAFKSPDKSINLSRILRLYRIQTNLTLPL